MKFLTPKKKLEPSAGVFLTVPVWLPILSFLVLQVADAFSYDFDVFQGILLISLYSFPIIYLYSIFCFILLYKNYKIFRGKTTLILLYLSGFIIILPIFILLSSSLSSLNSSLAR